MERLPAAIPLFFPEHLCQQWPHFYLPWSPKAGHLNFGRSDTCRGWRRACCRFSSDDLESLLRWHVCRAKFARTIFLELRIFLRKVLRNLPRNFRAFYFGVRKPQMGVEEMGVQGNPRVSEEKGLLPPFSGFSQVLFGPSGKGRKGQKKGEKGRFRPISGTGDQTPLKPPFVTPPFAAAQLGSETSAKFPPNFPARNQQKIHRRTSAGAQ